MAMSPPMHCMAIPPAQVVQSVVSDSQLAYFAGERSTPWWKAIDGRPSEDHLCVMEGFLECEDMVRLERLCLLHVAVFGDPNEVRNADASKEGNESPNYFRSTPVGVKENLSKWHNTLSDYLKTRNRCREHLTNRRAIRMRGGMAIEIDEMDEMEGEMEMEEKEAEEVEDVDETANFFPGVEDSHRDGSVDDSDRSESTGSPVKRNVVIGAAPHVRQRQQQLEGDSGRGIERRSAAGRPSGKRSFMKETSQSPGSMIVAPETFKSQKASTKGGRENLAQSTWGGHENSAQSTRSARENTSTGHSLPSVMTPTCPLSPIPLVSPKVKGSEHGVTPAFRSSRRLMSQSVSQDRLKRTGSDLAGLTPRDSHGGSSAGSKPQPSTPGRSSGSLPGSGKRDTRLQRTGASVASRTPPSSALPPS